MKIPFYGQLLTTDGRPRPVLSWPSLLLHAHPGWREGESRKQKIEPINCLHHKGHARTKHLNWHTGCGSQREPSKRKCSMSSVVTYKHHVWKSSTSREFIVTALSFTRPWASIMFPHLNFTVPFSSIHSDSLFLFVQREGDRRRFSFYLLWLQSVLLSLGLNTSVHCANSPQPLVFHFLKAHAVCQPGYDKVSLLWWSEGYCAAKQWLSKSTVCIVVFSQKMQRIHLCFWPV